MDHEKLADKAAHAAKSAGDYLADVRDSIVDTAGRGKGNDERRGGICAENVQKSRRQRKRYLLERFALENICQSEPHVLARRFHA